MPPAPALSLGRPVRRGAPPSSVEAVRETDSDALVSRMHACEAGYLPLDEYAPLFLKPGHPHARRPPLISIGTYLRVQEVDRYVDTFLRTGSLTGTHPTQERVQIVSLGAGSDTRFWRMAARTPTLHRYVELDFPESVQSKMASIQHHAALSAPLGEVHTTPHSLTGDTYGLLGTDLRKLAQQPSEWAIIAELLNPAYPTLLLCECVLAYMDKEAADVLLTQCMQYGPRMSVLCYDMCIAGDAPHTEASPTRFGQVMLQNLRVRHLALPGARTCTTPNAYQARFEALARATEPSVPMRLTQGAYTLCASWRALPSAERERITRLERLDEVEELEMLLGHYCMAWVERSFMVQ
ncbi:[phosphatase 2A protein]-leucine-carboxy methyltransferase [Malassezia equina]|uniref:Leucine carboxyl methyltransferase 1 n=1 Tax=Malassezia equina TaxID=1381935 RepID=A0AAF0EEI3_9BASI|nr:[phosphatase 2A protein]-leucine-carboxy methyltransferase [Malassezia equina]